FAQNQTKIGVSAIKKYLPMHYQEMRNVISMCYAKGLFKEYLTCYCKYLFIIDAKDIPPYPEKMEAAFRQFACELCERSVDHASMSDAVSILDRNMQRLGFSPETVIYSWEVVMKTASKLIPSGAQSSWDHILAHILKSHQLTSPKTIP